MSETKIQRNRHAASRPRWTNGYPLLRMQPIKEIVATTRGRPSDRHRWSAILRTPPYPPHSDHFRTAVHGTVFGQRTEVVHRLQQGDRLILVPDPPGTDEPAVWVHARGGDVVGHLPPDIARWLAPWMLDGGRCGALVEKVGGDDVESWRRVVIEVRCST